MLYPLCLYVQFVLQIFKFDFVGWPECPTHYLLACGYHGCSLSLYVTTESCSLFHTGLNKSCSQVAQRDMWLLSNLNWCFCTTKHSLRYTTSDLRYFATTTRENSIESLFQIWYCTVFLPPFFWLSWFFQPRLLSYHHVVEEKEDPRRRSGRRLGSWLCEESDQVWGINMHWLYQLQGMVGVWSVSWTQKSSWSGCVVASKRKPRGKEEAHEEVFPGPYQKETFEEDQERDQTRKAVNSCFLSWFEKGMLSSSSSFVVVLLLPLPPSSFFSWFGLSHVFFCNSIHHLPFLCLFLLLFVGAEVKWSGCGGVVLHAEERCGWLL